MGAAGALLVILKVMLYHFTLILIGKRSSLPAKVSQVFIKGKFSPSKNWTLALQEKLEKMEFSNPSLCNPPSAHSHKKHDSASLGQTDTLTHFVHSGLFPS